MAGSDDRGHASTVAADSQVPTVTETAISGQPGDGLAIGDTIGRYVLLERLGAGAMGVVWSALDPQLERKVAIKVVHPRLARAPEASSRLLREARALAKLSHRAVVTVHDAGDVGGRLFLAMELVPGTTLGSLLRARTPDELADWMRWLAMMLEAGRGLAAAHRAGVLHRDFKPDNVLVDGEQRVCVSDFGLAMLGDAPRDPIMVTPTSSHDDGMLTVTGALLGTPVYMSPQQLHGEPVDGRADQFAFCVATHEALYGARPFHHAERGADALVALASAIASGDIRQPASAAASTVPPAVATVLRRGLSSNPDERWPDMDALIAALEQAAEIHATVTAKTSAPERRRWIVAVAATGIVLGVAGLVVGRHDRGSPPAPEPQRLFGVQLHARFAVSPDGTRLAIARDRVEVREINGPQSWSRQLGPGEQVTHIEFLDGDVVRFSLTSGTELRRWAYTTNLAPTTEPSRLGGVWHGTVNGNELIQHVAPSELALVHDERTIERWPLDSKLDLVAIAPSGRRFAYVADGGRFANRIVVGSTASGAIIQSEPISELTAVTWADDDTLFYAAGILARSTILRMPVTADGFGIAIPMFSREAGWFARLFATRDRLFFVDAPRASHARIIDRTDEGATASVRDLEATTAAVPLGWAGNDLVMWNRRVGGVERRGGTSAASVTVPLDGEPANATFAGEVLIAAVRRPGGRELIAVPLAAGHTAWRHSVAERVLLARCAGDRAPPCFAVRSRTTGSSTSDIVVTIDPETGALGTDVVIAGTIEDLAVSADGERLVICDGTQILREIDLTGRELARYDATIPTTRSVAYDPKGGVLIAGTSAGNAYQLGRVTDTFTVLAQSDSDQQSLVRPSIDGTTLLVLARGFNAELWWLPRPDR